MQKVRIIIGALIATSIASVTANAVTLYDNLGVPTVASFGATAPGLYDSFSTGSQAVGVSGVNLLLSALTPGDGGTWGVGIVTDSSTSPSGTLIADGILFPDSGLSTTRSVVSASFNSSGPVTLAPNTRYWIVLLTNGSVQWAYSANAAGIGVAGEYWVDQTGVVHSNTSGPYQMQLLSTPVPAALPLFVGGLGFIGLVARRRKRAQNS